ncbi:MAG: GIY-YIG nuclease family protein [Opitutaceae bacterium]
MAKKVTDKDLELLGELGVETATTKVAARSPREQRIVAGFEEIERFVEAHKRLPEHGEDRDIFERIYAVRLDQLRKSQECRAALEGNDPKRLLEISEDYEAIAVNEAAPTDDELLNALGVEKRSPDDITYIKHVRPRNEIRSAEEKAIRQRCDNFGLFKPIFKQMQDELARGAREIIKCNDKTELKASEFYIVQGQTAYIHELGEPFIDADGRQDCRLLIIFDNGTESAMLRRSFQKRLWEDPASRRIIKIGEFGPLFSDAESEDDCAVGYIYVLRSESKHPFIAENRSVIHKIGVTTGSVKKRISNAEKDPTYLLSKVQIVETYKLANMNPQKLEKLIHQFFASARLDLDLKDRFGQNVEPREWFLVPLPVIEGAVKLLMAGELTKFQYDPSKGKIVSV